MARRKTVSYKDFKVLFANYTKAIEANEVLREDPILRQTLNDFGRMAEMNDNLWKVINDKGYYVVDEKSGRITLNPAIGTFNKNVSTLLKSAQYLQEKTAAIALNDSKKSW